jgi:hypothetical protein
MLYAHCDLLSLLGYFIVGYFIFGYFIVTDTLHSLLLPIVTATYTYIYTYPSIPIPAQCLHSLVGPESPISRYHELQLSYVSYAYRHTKSAIFTPALLPYCTTAYTAYILL